MKSKLGKMHGTAASVLYQNLVSECQPSHDQYQDLYTFEWQFIYEYAKTSLYEWQKDLGMLSPHAEIYYPPTKNLSRKQNTMEKVNNI